MYTHDIHFIIMSVPYIEYPKYSFFFFLEILEEIVPSNSK